MARLGSRVPCGLGASMAVIVVLSLLAALARRMPGPAIAAGVHSSSGHASTKSGARGRVGCWPTCATSRFDLWYPGLIEAASADRAWAAQAAPDLWTANVPVSAPPPGGSPTRAFIITSDTRSLRYRYSAVRVAAAGLTPTPHIGRWPADPLRPGGLHAFCANKHAHRNAWARFSEDSNAALDDWAFFFEDDIAFTGNVAPSAVHIAWRAAIAGPDAAAHGVIWLGLCGQPARDLTSLTLLAPGVGATTACGPCLHAYGLRKDVAATFWADMEKEWLGQGWDCNTTAAILAGAGPGPHLQVNADAVVLEMCRATPHGWTLVGANLQSRLVSGSFALLHSWGTDDLPFFSRRLMTTEAFFSRIASLFHRCLQRATTALQQALSLASNGSSTSSGGASPR
jgi:hypothetical protein